MSDSARNSDIEWLIEDAWIVRPFVIEVWFEDATHRLIDMSHQLDGEVFEPRRDPDYFLRGSFDRDAGTTTWPNGADLAPEFFRYAPESDLTLRG